MGANEVGTVTSKSVEPPAKPQHPVESKDIVSIAGANWNRSIFEFVSPFHPIENLVNPVESMGIPPVQLDAVSTSLAASNEDASKADQLDVSMLSRSGSHDAVISAGILSKAPRKKPPLSKAASSEAKGSSAASISSQGTIPTDSEIPSVPEVASLKSESVANAAAGPSTDHQLESDRPKSSFEPAVGIHRVSRRRRLVESDRLRYVEQLLCCPSAHFHSVDLHPSSRIVINANLQDQSSRPIAETDATHSPARRSFAVSGSRHASVTTEGLSKGMITTVHVVVSPH
jgi:hypothetical protein